MATVVGAEYTEASADDTCRLQLGDGINVLAEHNLTLHYPSPEDYQDLSRGDVFYQVDVGTGAGAFDAVVSGGERRMLGMPRFPNYTQTELRALQHYIRREAEE